MGVLRSTKSFEAQVEEFQGMLLLQQQQQGTDANSTKQDLQKPLLVREMLRERGLKPMKAATNINEEGTICVTSGASFLGLSLVNSLLSHGYTVRLLLDSPDDLEKVGEIMQIFGSRPSSNGDDNNSVVKAEITVVTDMMDVNLLIQAFQNCTCVFHTSAFTDPAGVSGYSKHKAEIEARIAEKVIEACVSTKSVRKCVFTSSLLSCIWRCQQNHSPDLPTVVDENSWTDESFCREKKLWYALGKTMAEKAAWRVARGRDLKLVTLCPGLVTGPGFSRRNSTASIAYLKGGQHMLRKGLLATVDAGKLAEMHISVYEAMGRTACGRYICFDRIIRRVEDVVELEQQIGIPAGILLNEFGSNEPRVSLFELSKRKLSRLMCLSRSCSHRLGVAGFIVQF